MIFSVSRTSSGRRDRKRHPSHGASVHKIIMRVKNKVGYVLQPIRQQKGESLAAGA